jgi:dTDP-glucose pyrophosphorylase
MNKKECHPTVLRGDETLQEAIACLKDAPWGVAVINDDEGRFVNSISDFDIRLAILQRWSLTEPVTVALARRPATVAVSDSDEVVLGVLESRRLRALPVLDDRGIAVGMRSIDEFSVGEPQPSAVIMAGGRGQRLRPLTDNVPKPLLRVGGESIIGRIIHGLTRAGINDVHLAVNYKAQSFHQRLGDGEAWGVTLHYVHEEKELGTGGALSLIEPPGGPLIVTNGDIVTSIDFGRLLDFHRRQGAAITVGGVDHVSHVPYGVLETVNHHLISIQEKPDRRELCNAGIYVLEPHVLRYLTPGAHANMPDLIADALADGAAVSVFPIFEKWFDIGSPAEFERILKQFATGEET